MRKIREENRDTVGIDSWILKDEDGQTNRGTDGKTKTVHQTEVLRNEGMYENGSGAGLMGQRFQVLTLAPCMLCWQC